MSTTMKQSQPPVFDVDPGELPAGLRVYLEEHAPATAGPAPAASCCGPAKQETCCEPSDKDACCGTEATADGGCGCQ